MKKIIALLLVFVFMMTSVTAFADTYVSDEYDMEAESARQQKVLDRIEDNIDEIHAEIAEYQENGKI